MQRFLVIISLSHSLSRFIPLYHSFTFRYEFDVLFSETGFQCGEKARQRAVNCGLSDCLIRSICWRFFLGHLVGEPTEEWLAQLSESRAEYEYKKKQFLVDPHDNVTNDLEVDNPLSTDERSSWKHFFVNKKVEDQLNLDLERLFPDNPFFQRKEVITSMRTILLVWIRSHPEYEYCQGMHEILGGLYYVYASTNCRSDHPLSATSRIN